MLEWLKNILGDAYTEEIDKQVSEAIGKDFVSKTDFNAKNDAAKQLAEQLKDRDGQLEELKKVDAEGLQKRIEELQELNDNTKKDYESKLEQVQFDHALENALSGAKARNAKAVKALLDMEGLKLNNGEIVGLDKQLETLKADNGYLFEGEENAPHFAAQTDGPKASGLDAARAIMGLPPEK